MKISTFWTCEHWALGRFSSVNLIKTQNQQCQLYDKGTKLRQFAPEDKVLVLLPSSSSKLQGPFEFKWQGPFEVTQRVGDVDYEVVQTERSGACQIYHLNLLKQWREPDGDAGNNGYRRGWPRTRERWPWSVRHFGHQGWSSLQAG